MVRRLTPIAAAAAAEVAPFDSIARTISLFSSVALRPYCSGDRLKLPLSSSGCSRSRVITRSIVASQSAANCASHRRQSSNVLRDTSAAVAASCLLPRESSASSALRLLSVFSSPNCGFLFRLLSVPPMSASHNYRRNSRRSAPRRVRVRQFPPVRHSFALSVLRQRRSSPPSAKQHPALVPPILAP